jgi:hypothetical protein
MVANKREQPTDAQSTHEEGRGTTLWDFLTASLFIVLTAILTVALMDLGAMFVLSTTGEGSADATVSVLTAGTGVIGTLVGSFLGLKLGTEDKDRIQDQAEQYRQQSDQLMRAIAMLPPAQAEEVLRQVNEASAPSTG